MIGASKVLTKASLRPVISMASKLRGPFLPQTLLLIFFAVDVAWAQTEAVLYSFTGGADGGVPYGSVTMDAAGNLYGTTSQYGGTCAFPSVGCGTVFELTHTQDEMGEHWAYNVIYTFQGGDDGYFPASTLVLDSSGNLYGTTANGGIGRWPF